MNMEQIDLNGYRDIFQKAAQALDISTLQDHNIEIAVVHVVDSIVLKLYKKSWSNPLEDPLTADTRIFFSIWVNKSSLEKQQLVYNIHALKLRHLKGYAIQSRTFAALFRKLFQEYQHKWPNCSTEYGPLTLMQGWQLIHPEYLQQQIIELANKFSEIEYLIDTILEEFRC
jgi:hypothetical protein